MGDYHVAIQNRSGASHAYVLSAAPPQVSSSPGFQVFQNFCLAARPVPSPHGLATFNLFKQLYALTGTAASLLSGSVNSSSSYYELVSVCTTQGGQKKIGSAVQMTVEDGGPHFKVDTLAQTSTTEGAFSIETDKSFHADSPR